MMTKKVLTAPGRPLFIDFDAYTDGDAEFKGELVVLMIDNLVEMQDVLQRATKSNDMKLFHGVCHKIKATIEMLADAEFSQTISDLKQTLTDSVKVTLLDTICAEIIDSLRRESI